MQADYQRYRQRSQASSRRIPGHLDLASHKEALAGDPVTVRQPCMVHADAELQRMAQVGILQHRQEGKASGDHPELVLNRLYGHHSKMYGCTQLGSTSQVDC